MIHVVPDGDVFRIVDEQGRRYYYRPEDSTHALWALERCCHGNAWNEHTAFTEREAKLIVDAVQREQRALAVADKLAAGLAAFCDVITAAREWTSRREHGNNAVADLLDGRLGAMGERIQKPDDRTFGSIRIGGRR